MFQFDTNTDIPRRTQFWQKITTYFPISYASSTLTYTILYQFGLATDHTVAVSSLVFLYVHIGLISMVGGLTTVARHYRQDFNTWWTENPQYSQMEDQEPFTGGFTGGFADSP